MGQSPSLMMKRCQELITDSSHVMSFSLWRRVCAFVCLQALLFIFHVCKYGLSEATPRQRAHNGAGDNLEPFRFIITL
jgi:hypothetical protein